MAINPQHLAQDFVDFDKCAQNPEPTRSAVRMPEDKEIADLFRELWNKVTDDNHLTLYGFKRFRTTHLLNLRFLEKEIDILDRQIFQAGFKLGQSPPLEDKLGLRHGKVDRHALGVEEVMTREKILKMRELIKQYGMLSLTQSVVFSLPKSFHRRWFNRFQ